MSELVADCPRCSAKHMTFDLRNQVVVELKDWQHVLEVFCVCRNCRLPTIFRVGQKNIKYATAIKEGLQKYTASVNGIVEVQRFISVQDNSASKPPDYLPEQIDLIFKEGASCLAIGCNNAAATMFRLCLDLATQSLLPTGADAPANPIKRNLGLRLPWLFEKGILPIALQELSNCIKDDGNDGAHEGILNANDAADILDFTYILLERLYTEPKRLELAAARRLERKK